MPSARAATRLPCLTASTSPPRPSGPPAGRRRRRRRRRSNPAPAPARWRPAAASSVGDPGAAGPSLTTTVSGGDQLRRVRPVSVSAASSSALASSRLPAGSQSSRVPRRPSGSGRPRRRPPRCRRRPPPPARAPPGQPAGSRVQQGVAGQVQVILGADQPGQVGRRQPGVGAGGRDHGALAVRADQHDAAAGGQLGSTDTRVRTPAGAARPPPPGRPDRRRPGRRN